MSQNAWIRDGGFYWKDAPIISGAGLDVAAHPQVLLKQTETSRIDSEELSDKYREKILGLVWMKRGFNDILDFSIHGDIIFRIMKKLESKSGWNLDKEKEGSIFYKLLEHGIIWASSLDINGNRATVTCEIWPEIADIFVDITSDSTIANTLKKADWIMEHAGLDHETWKEALKCCRDESFIPNLKQMNGGAESRGLVLLLKNPVILLRYHGLKMEKYRGTNNYEHPENNHWVGENWPKCDSCWEEIAGSQNFTRIHGTAIHTSCIPEHLEKYPVREEGFEEYLRAVYHAMFPKRAETKE